MAYYSDYLLLGGVLFCVISVIYAVVQLMQTQPPRGAAVTLVIGIVLLFTGALTAPQTFTPKSIFDAWGRVTSGQPAKAAGETDAPAVVSN